VVDHEAVDELLEADVGVAPGRVGGQPRKVGDHAQALVAGEEGLFEPGGVRRHLRPGVDGATARVQLGQRDHQQLAAPVALRRVAQHGEVGEHGVDLALADDHQPLAQAQPVVEEVDRDLAVLVELVVRPVHATRVVRQPRFPRRVRHTMSSHAVIIDLTA
jgi:hypothetical protein